MRNERVRRERVCGQGQGLEGRVEVRDAVLREEPDEVEAADGELARGGREGAGVVVVEGLELGEVAVEGGDVSCPYTPERADFQYFACALVRSVFTVS